jgi:PAS domain S-box-containing protein
MRKIPLKIILSFLMIGILWVSSNALIQDQSSNATAVSSLHYLKDLFFIAISFLLLYILFREYAIKQAASEKEYKQLFEINPHPIWLYRREDFKFLAVNKAALEQYGYSREEFMAMRLQDLLAPGKLSSFKKAVAKSKSENSIKDEFITCHRKKSGLLPSNKEIPAGFYVLLPCLFVSIRIYYLLDFYPSYQRKLVRIPAS